MREEAARERWQQGAIGDEMAVLPGVLKEEEAIKEKDKLLREAQVEVTPEAVGVGLGITNTSFEKQSACEAVGTVGWLLLSLGNFQLLALYFLHNHWACFQYRRRQCLQHHPFILPQLLHFWG